jgi:malonyl-CoA decarboxylase
MRRLNRIQKSIRSVVASDGEPPELLAEIRSAVESIDDEARLELYRWMAADLEVDPAMLDEPMAELSASGDDPVARSRALDALRAAVASPRRILFECFSHLPRGVEFVLALRAEVLETQRSGEPGLDPLEDDLADVLTGWFRHGFLRLGEIDRRSPFEQIRFLKERELVHPMVRLEDMGRRLGVDRRCFALFHCLIPDEPVVFIEVALTRGLVTSIHEIIDEPDGDRPPESRPDTAIFYSINNTQNGLAGLGLGKVLIFRVTEALEASHPGVRRHATLSPIPGFWPRYLKRILDGDERFVVSRQDVVDTVGPKASQALHERWVAQGGAAEADLPTILLTVLDRSDWVEDPHYPNLLARPLEDIAYRYLTEETDRRGKPLNPVAGFHLGNGATVARRDIHFGANRTPRGVAESCTLMVNYLYSTTWLQQIGRGVKSLLPFGR